MNPWIAKVVVLAASAVMIATRAPHGQRSRRAKVAKDRKSTREVVLLSLSMLAFVMPLIWVASPVFAFADYPLRPVPLVTGTAFLIAGLWLFHRSHADLGVNWSITLQIREHHQLITHGVYRRVRHPMYGALFLYSIGQLLALPNWFAGASHLIVFAILFALRVRVEERMMVEEFGDQYVAYAARTKRLIPGLW